MHVAIPIMYAYAYILLAQLQALNHLVLFTHMHDITLAQS